MLVNTMGIGAILMLAFREEALSTTIPIVLVMDGTNKGGIQGEVVLM
jgi:hypothetical protein